VKVTLLGTGTSQGVPVIGCNCKVCQSDDKKDNRLRTSAMLENKDLTLIIDTGPDFRQQMLREEVSDIDAVIYTHEHRDHIAGLDDIRPINFINRKSMQIYAEDRVLNALKQMLPYAFGENRYPGVPELNLNKIDLSEFYIGDTKIIPLRVYHYKLPVMGFRIGDFAYITDANYIPEEEKEKLFGVKYLVINALRKKKHISHFTLNEALNIVNELSPRKAFITHVSHQMGLHAEVNKELPKNVQLAYDRLSFTVK
jgi:phosphoribosyl 1,2-cyclic phosphate phosphodiesterase